MEPPLGPYCRLGPAKLTNCSARKGYLGLIMKKLKGNFVTEFLNWLLNTPSKG